MAPPNEALPVHLSGCALGGGSSPGRKILPLTSPAQPCPVWSPSALTGHGSHASLFCRPFPVELRPCVCSRATTGTISPLPQPLQQQAIKQRRTPSLANARPASRNHGPPSCSRIRGRTQRILPFCATYVRAKPPPPPMYVPVPSHPSIPPVGGARCHARHARHAHKIDADPSNPLLTDPQSSSFALADCARPVLLCAPPETFQLDCLSVCLSRPQRLARLLLLMLPARPPTAHP